MLLKYIDRMYNQQSFKGKGGKFKKHDFDLSKTVRATTRTGRFCPFGKFLPSRLGNCQQNSPNENVDKARMNFSFGLDSNICPFLTSRSGISCAYSSKARASTR